MGLDAATMAWVLGALTVLGALALDRWWGEPPLRWHPVAWMGHGLGAAGRRLRRQPAGARAFVAGALAWTAGALGVLALAGLAQRGVQWLATAPAPLGGLGVGLSLLLGSALLKPMLAWRMLRDEVKAVDQALAVSLAQARGQLARLVSRDTQALDAPSVREAAIETLAENLNDSVVAPLFWFAVAGLPGAALYRFANTADAMWGYRGDWEWAGKWAARADDVLSWLPARLTAWLLSVAVGHRRSWRGVRGLAAQAGRTPSPNSGWPMGAMALLLGCRLGKPGVYALNDQARAPNAADHAQALLWAGRVVGLVALLAALVGTLALGWGLLQGSASFHPGLPWQAPAPALPVVP